MRRPRPLGGTFAMRRVAPYGAHTCQASRRSIIVTTTSVARLVVRNLNLHADEQLVRADGTAPIVVELADTTVLDNLTPPPAPAQPTR